MNDQRFPGPQITGPRRVHMVVGFDPAGARVRALCACGERTTPRATREHAVEALESEHGYSAAACAQCGRDRNPDHRHGRARFEHLQLLVDGEPAHHLEDFVRGLGHGHEAWMATWLLRDLVLVCRDETAECDQTTQQRHRHAEAEEREHGARRIVHLLPGREPQR